MKKTINLVLVLALLGFLAVLAAPSVHAILMSYTTGPCDNIQRCTYVNYLVGGNCASPWTRCAYDYLGIANSGWCVKENCRPGYNEDCDGLASVCGAYKRYDEETHQSGYACSRLGVCHYYEAPVPSYPGPGPCDTMRCTGFNEVPIMGCPTGYVCSATFGIGYCKKVCTGAGGQADCDVMGRIGQPGGWCQGYKAYSNFQGDCLKAPNLSEGYYCNLPAFGSGVCEWRNKPADTTPSEICIQQDVSIGPGSPGSVVSGVANSGYWIGKCCADSSVTNKDATLWWTGNFQRSGAAATVQDICCAASCVHVNPAGSSYAWGRKECSIPHQVLSTQISCQASPYGLSCGASRVAIGTYDSSVCNTKCELKPDDSRCSCIDPSSKRCDVVIDNCPYVSNPDQADTDKDGVGNACDICPGDEPDSCPAAMQGRGAITSSGGTVSTPGGTSVSVPAGAVATQVSLTIASVQGLSGSTRTNSHGDILVAYDVYPSDFNFSLPVNLTITYEQGNMPQCGRQEQLIKIYYLDTASVEWIALGGIVDCNANKVDVQINKTNRFAVIAPLDTDYDGVFDDWGSEKDNCWNVSNPDQHASDNNTIGDACNGDWDNDGILNNVDNCPYVSNPDQADTDNDTIGNACDDDWDNDGILNNVDNCPYVSNPAQTDTDGNGVGDACDDEDGDNILGTVDNCPAVYNPDQLNSDGDSLGDVCDICPIDTMNSCDSTRSDSAYIYKDRLGILATENSALLTPPNSLPADTTLSMQQSTVLPQDIVLNGVTMQFLQGAHYVFVPRDVQLLAPATVYILTGCTFGAATCSMMQLVGYDALSGAWAPLANQGCRNNGTVYICNGTTMHLGNFSLVVPRAGEVTGAADDKKNVLSALVSLRPSESEAKKQLTYAMQEINLSLGNLNVLRGDKEIVWLDSSHLLCKHGEKVFAHEKKAVDNLQKAMAATKNATIDTKLNASINVLVGVDRTLAQTAISQAQALIAGGNTTIKQRDLDKALEAMAKGDAETKVTSKIEQYKKAWKYVNKHCLLEPKTCIESITVKSPKGEIVTATGDEVSSLSTLETLFVDNINNVQVKIQTSCSKCLKVGQSFSSWIIQEIVFKQGYEGNMTRVCGTR